MESRAHIKFAVLAVDTVLFTISDGELLVRLMRVRRPPHFPNSPGFPGGLIDPREVAEHAAKKYIEERGGIAPDKAYFEQFYTFDAPDRDPRGRVIAVGFIGLIPWDALGENECSYEGESYWSLVSKTKRLAYDHDEMLVRALKHLRGRVESCTLIQKLMPSEFTLSELEHAYASILGKSLDKRNFRKKILKLGILAPVTGKRTQGRFRPAQLYRFKSSSVEEIRTV